MKSNGQLKDEIAKAWDYGAADYDKHFTHGLHSSAEKQAWFDVLQEILDFGAGNEGRPLKIADVGTGTGFLALLLAELGHEVYGFDISDEMLKEARHKAEQQGLANVRFETGDAEKLPLADSELDIIISRHVFWTLPHPQSALAEWQRVVKSGGRVAVIDGLWGIELDRWQKVKGRFGQLLKQVRGTKGQPHETHYDEQMLAQLPVAGLRQYPELVALFKEAGFVDVALRSIAQVEQAERVAMPLHERLIRHYRRYLLTCTVA